MKCITLLVLFFPSFLSVSQGKTFNHSYQDTIPENTNKKKDHYIQAEYIGGREAMTSFITENLKYPDSALKYEVEATFVVRFTITKQGKIKDVHLAPNQPVPVHGMGDEAIRVIASMPVWKPATLKGKPVTSYKALPVIFKIT